MYSLERKFNKQFSAASLIPTVSNLLSTSTKIFLEILSGSQVIGLKLNGNISKPLNIAYSSHIVAF